MSAERNVTDWLRAEAPPIAPDHLLTTTLGKVAAIPQDRGILSRWFETRTRRGARPMLLLAATLVGLGLIGGLAALANRPPTPTPAPSGPGWTAIKPYPPHATDTLGVTLVRDDGMLFDVADTATNGRGQACPVVSPDGTKLAYIEGTPIETESLNGYSVGSLRDKKLAIVAIAEDGTTPPLGVIEPTGDGRGVGCVTWAPDGSRLAYTDGSYVYAANAAGDPVEIAIGDRVFDWSPDGRVLYSDHGRVRITDTSGNFEEVEGLGDSVAIRWAPGTSNVAVERSPQADPSAERQLVLRDMSTGSERVLETPYLSLPSDGPEWSPDGKHLAYIRFCEACSIGSEIAVLDVATGDEQVFPAAEIDGIRWHPGRVTWTPDGRALRAIAWREGTDSLGQPTSVGDAVVIVPLEGQARLVAEGKFTQ